MWVKLKNKQLVNLNLVQSISFGEKGWAIYFTGNDCIEISDEEYNMILNAISKNEKYVSYIETKTIAELARLKEELSKD